MASSSSRPLPLHLTILYASATGTAEDLAQRVSRLALRHRFAVQVLSFAALSLEELIKVALQGPLVFLVATAGNGSFPPNCEPLWQSLLSTRLIPGQTLDKMSFSIFGLGDSSYPRFCWPERMLRKRLVDLGAKEMAERGEGDEQHYLGIEGTFQPYLAELFEQLKSSRTDSSDQEMLPFDAPLPPSLELRFLDSSSSGHLKGHSNGAASSSDPTMSNGHAFTAPSEPKSSTSTRWLHLTKNERLTSDSHFQDVRRLELTLPDDSSEEDLRYQPGDIAALRPSNDPDNIDALIERMGWQEHADRSVGIWDRSGQRVELPPISGPSPTSSPTNQITFRDYLIHHTAPFAALRPSLFPLLLPFTPPDSLEREKLTEFSTPGDGYEEAMEYGVKTRRTIFEVLEEFKTIQFGPEWAAEIFGQGREGVREREFSIASCPSSSPRTITLIIAIVSYQTRIRSPRLGLATRWIAKLEPSPDVLVPVNIRSSPILRLPPSDEIPMILVGPGTGMAPIRSLVLERLARAKAHTSSSSSSSYGDILCFFGCRSYPNEDALLYEEWSQLASEHSETLTVQWASSRFNPKTSTPRPKGEKEYVQDLITSPINASRIWEMILSGAWIYICGSSGSMPREVRRAIGKVLEDQGGLEEDQSERMLTRLEEQGRWREEAWS